MAETKNALNAQEIKPKSGVDMKTLHRIAMLSYAYGGFLLLSTLMNAYMFLWRGEVRPSSEFNQSRFVLNATNAALNATRSLPDESPVTRLVSPFSILSLVSGIGFILNGFYLSRYVKKTETRHTREFTISTMLTDDERRLFDALREKGGSATQKALSMEVGVTAVQTHRVVARLVQKKVVDVHPFGMTNKVIITDGEKA